MLYSLGFCFQKGGGRLDIFTGIYARNPFSFELLHLGSPVGRICAECVYVRLEAEIFNITNSYFFLWDRISRISFHPHSVFGEVEMLCKERTKEVDGGALGHFLS